MMYILLVYFGATSMTLTVWIRLQRLIKSQSQSDRGRVSTVTGDSKLLVLGLSQPSKESLYSCSNAGCSHSQKLRTSSVKTRVEYYEYLEL